MEMTIDDAIKHIGQARYDYCEYWEETRNDTTIAFDIAMDTMRKYQKIQEIINNTDYIQEDVIRYKMICGVIEDGNNE